MDKKKEENNFESEKRKAQYKKIFTDIIGKFFNVIMVLFVLVVFVIGYNYVLRPKYDNVSTVIAERNRLKINNLNILKNNISTIDRYKTAYNKIGDESLKKINTILPSFGSNEEFFTAFEEMVLKKGFLITNLAVSSDEDKDTSVKKKSAAAPAPTGKDPEIGIVNIKMSVIGVDYRNMKKLLELIENNQRIMDVQSVSYSYTGETVSMDITTYYLK